MVVRNHEDLDWRDLGRVAALSRDEMMSRPMAYTMYAGKTIQRPLSSSSVIESKPQRERESAGETDLGIIQRKIKVTRSL